MMMISDSDFSRETSEGDYDCTEEILEQELSLNESPGRDFDNDDENCVGRRKRAKKAGITNSNKGTQGKRLEEEMQNPFSDLACDLNWSPADNDKFYEWQLKNQMGRRRRKKKSTPILMWELWEYKLDRWIDEHINADIDLDQHNEVIKETWEAPAELIMPLLRYQKEWLSWALKQEESKSRGGILADEMGMGKTIQAIALVLAKRQISRSITEAAGPSSSASSSTRLPVIKSTLVICPVVAVSQWVNEILQFTSEGSTKVLVYHGPNRARVFEQFSNYDFVITTYSIVEADFRKYMMPPKDICKWCGKQFYSKRMTMHLNYFCGPNAVKTSKQSKQKRKQTKSHILSKPKTKSGEKEVTEQESEEQVASSKNSKKRKLIKDIKTAVTSNNPAETEIHEGKSILHSVKWERIILDEAHYIKDRRSNTARAVLSLESSYKWALSGTPLQNRVGELYSLIRFLQIAPYSFYWCKDCNCRTLDYSPSSECSNCPHKSVRHFCWWNRHVATPIQDSGNKGAGIRAMVLLKHKILKSILLRRTKKGRASDLALPPRIITLRRDTLDIKEMDYYTALYNDSQAEFNTYVTDGTLMNNYAHIFDLLTRLRQNICAACKINDNYAADFHQAVDHPYLVVYSKSNFLKCESNADCDNSEQECGLCHDPVEDSVTTSCQHVFCKACLLNYCSSLGQVLCPTCMKPLTADFTSSSNDGNQRVTTVKGFRASSILSRIRLDDFQTSTKIDALREEIRFMIERDGSAKGIVFSQFTSFLDLINYSLQKSGVSCVQLVGSMTMAARDSAIAKFSEDPDCRIFLMSLKAGGVALNLTVASHVFLMDPWWNPAVERQAMDRIHRIGQYKPIRIVRFVIENTVEERILKLQEKKELVFEGTVGGSSDALGKLTVEDLRFLFY